MLESKGINSSSYGWMLHPPLSCVFSESVLSVSREEEGERGGCLQRERCVGVGSIPVSGNVFSILRCCNVFISPTRDGVHLQIC